MYRFRFELESCIVISRFGYAAIAYHCGIARQIGLVFLDLDILHFNLVKRFSITELVGGNIQFHLVQPGLGSSDVNSILCLAHLEQNLAGFNMLIISHIDFINEARDIGGQRYLCGIGIAIVG